ncbi:MFS transporter [Nakamurella sp.]|uniref:MFS transporter n=1 Tax=Nakamurella sp. TaxID=1869182 RepID=UPI0037848BDD
MGQQTNAQPGPPDGLAYASARGKWVLTATVLGSGLAMLDGTVVNVALPRIGEDLGGGLTALQWTLNAYTLTLSGLLLLGGSLGDRMGRRRVYIIGVIWFTLASIGCAGAPSTGVLIAMRALQGAGAALLTPGSLAILQASFRREDRSTAVGAWSGLGGVATALGPIIGGLLVGVAPWGWRLVFLINLPIAVVVVVLSRRYVPESRDEQATGRLDVPGAVLASVGLGGVIYGLTEGPANGWTPVTIAVTATGAVLLALFLLVETRTAEPLLPLGLFRERQFTAANLVTFAVYAALAGALFLLPVQLQLVAGFSPVEAGAATLPITVMMLLLSARMGRLAARIGPRLPMTVGPIVAGLAMVWLSRVDAGATYLGAVLGPMLLFGLGLSTTVAPLTSTVLAAAPDHQAGVASAINNDVARVAGLIAVAVLPALAGLSPAAYADPAMMSAGFHRAVLIAGAVCAAGGLLALVTIRNPTHPATPAESHDHSDPALSCAACPVLAPHIKPR